MAELLKLDYPNYGKVVSSEKPTFVFYNYPWDAVCTKVRPYIEELADEIPEVTFAEVNMAMASQLAELNGVRVHPSYLLYVKGEVLRQGVGFKNKERLRAIALG